MINETSKPKPHINMITKSLSQKQITIPISSENIVKLMKF